VASPLTPREYHTMLTATSTTTTPQEDSTLRPYYDEPDEENIYDTPEGHSEDEESTATDSAEESEVTVEDADAFMTPGQSPAPAEQPLSARAERARQRALRQAAWEAAQSPPSRRPRK